MYFDASCITRNGCRMPKSRKRVRIIPFPYEAEIFDAHLQRIHLEPGITGTDIVFTFDSFQPHSTPEACDQEGRPHERLSGLYVPMRLRFSDASWIRKTGVYDELDTLAQDHGARRIFSVLQSEHTGSGRYFWFSTGADEYGELSLEATGCLLEHQPGLSYSAEIVRRWSPVPPQPPGQVPHRPALYRRFGGDPIRIRLGRRVFARRLFIGGLFQQHEERPQVHHVLNLCGVENPWCATEGFSSEDRAVRRGEMAAGMAAMDVFEEAAWVAERLRAGRRVLVHCYAGVNRSSTVCCATLMFLEGIGPEEALARVRQFHPMAWPDPYHWFVLRWMARALDLSSLGSESGSEPPKVPVAQGAPLLREETAIG
jgi:hypothetical protein